MTKAFEAALKKAVKINPKQAAKNCDFHYEGTAAKGFFALPVLDEEIKLSFPEFEIPGTRHDKGVDETLITIAMYHLSSSDGFPLSNRWISFSKLPGGQYASAMKGYTSEKIQDYFGNGLAKLAEAAKRLGGEELRLSGDLAFKFRVFPKIPIALIYWKGDDEFPESRADFLFDESAPHYLPTDCYAILCSLLTQRLIHKKRLIGA